MSFTLSTLKTAIQDYLESSETTFVNNLDNIIKESEERIFKLVQLPDQRKNVQGTAETNNRFLSTPSDYNAAFSLAVIDGTTYHYLELKHPSFIKQFVTNTSTNGRPRYYSQFDENTFELGPKPDSNYTVELHYLAKPTSLTAGSDSGTTYLSTEYSDALLYGCLAEGAIFLKETPDVVANFENRFKEAIMRAKNLSEGRLQRDEYRYDSLRIDVS
tara:strand:- start:1413 stop:2060 length:648 start_codon:yes stop_codon:yes gene_type:complete